MTLPFVSVLMTSLGSDSVKGGDSLFMHFTSYLSIVMFVLPNAHIASD